MTTWTMTTVVNITTSTNPNKNHKYLTTPEYFLATHIELTNCTTKINFPKSDRSNSILRVIGAGQFRRHSSHSPNYNPAILKIGEATTLPVMLCGLLQNHWDQAQPSDDDDNKGNNQFVDQFEGEVHDEQDNQPNYHLTNSKLNDILRDKLTIFNRKHYASLPLNPTAEFDKSRKNSYNCSAYIN